MNQAASDFHHTTRQLTSAAEEARRAIESIRSTISGAAETARRASVDLTQTFLREYRWSVFSVCGAALTLGFGLGVLSHLWIDTPGQNPQPVVTPAFEQAPQTHKRSVSAVKSAQRKRVQQNASAEATSPGSKE